MDNAIRSHVRERANQRCEYCLLIPENSFSFSIQDWTTGKNTFATRAQSVGKTTVFVLDMNEESRVSLRLEYNYGHESLG